MKQHVRNDKLCSGNYADIFSYFQNCSARISFYNYADNYSTGPNIFEIIVRSRIHTENITKQTYARPHPSRHALEIKPTSALIFRALEITLIFPVNSRAAIEITVRLYLISRADLEIT